MSAPTASRLFLIGFDGMNHPLLRRFVAEGHLPNFASLLERGSLNRLLPSLPPWTPTNWMSVVTGASPGTHQLGGWRTRDASGDPERYVPCWHASSLGGAETLWEVADRAGKRCLINHYPAGSWDAPLEHGYVIAPGLHEAPFSHVPGETYVAAMDAGAPGTGAGVARATLDGAATDVEEQGETPGELAVRLVSAGDAGWDGVGPHDLAAVLPIRPRHTGEASDLHLLVARKSPTEVEDIFVCAERRRDSALVSVPRGSWGEFARMTLRGTDIEVAMRFTALDMRFDESGARVAIVRSAAYATHGISSPSELDRDLVEKCGPFFDLLSVNPDVDDARLELWLDEMRYIGEWQVRVAEHVDREYGWDLHFSHWHAFDWINHFTGNGLDPAGPDYDPARAEWLLDAQRRTYKLGDDILGQFLALEREGDLVCVVADHGITATHRYGDAARLLEEAGLMKRTPTGQVDWENSAAYYLPKRGAEIFINLKGRELNGIVDPGDYVSVQEAIVDALLDWRDPADGRRVCALALKANDAQLVGYWGPESGDVVYILNRGFGWGEPAGEGSVGDGRIAIHGAQIPTSENEDLSNLGCLIVAGPGVRGGYERDWERWGLMRMVDVAPTVATRLDLPIPRHNNGAFLGDIFSD